MLSPGDGQEGFRFLTEPARGGMEGFHLCGGTESALVLGGTPGEASLFSLWVLGEQVREVLFLFAGAGAGRKAARDVLPFIFRHGPGKSS